jgi:hypothetical protein
VDDQLTPILAYKAMMIFIENYYYRGGEPDDIGLLLGIMQFLDDDKPADPALWNDWMEAVKRVLEAK